MHRARSKQLYVLFVVAAAVAREHWACSYFTLEALPTPYLVMVRMAPVVD